MEKILIAITGKSGSGKTFISNLLAEKLNAYHLEFDKISHIILDLPNVKKFIKNAISAEVFNKNDKISRKDLGRIVFAEHNKLNTLNDFCEIEMEKIIDNIIYNIKNNIIILDYSLLPKMKYFEKSKIKILIKSNLRTRKNRILKRDKINEEYFALRETSSLKYRTPDYDIVLFNNKNVNFNELLEKINNLLEKL